MPPYASSIHIELYKTDENKHYLQIFYRRFNEEYPEPKNIPGCGQKCDLKQFHDLYKHIIPADFDTECQLTQ